MSMASPVPLNATKYPDGPPTQKHDFATDVTSDEDQNPLRSDSDLWSADFIVNRTTRSRGGNGERYPALSIKPKGSHHSDKQHFHVPVSKGFYTEFGMMPKFFSSVGLDKYLTATRTAAWPKDLDYRDMRYYEEIFDKKYGYAHRRAQLSVEDKTVQKMEEAKGNKKGHADPSAADVSRDNSDVEAGKAFEKTWRDAVSFFGSLPSTSVDDEPKKFKISSEDKYLTHMGSDCAGAELTCSLPAITISELDEQGRERGEGRSWLLPWAFEGKRLGSSGPTSCKLSQNDMESWLGEWERQSLVARFGPGTEALRQNALRQLRSAFDSA